MNETSLLQLLLKTDTGETHYPAEPGFAESAHPLPEPRSLPEGYFIFTTPWNETHNFTGPLSLLDILGPKRQELYKVIPVTVIYIVIFVTGIIGNICTCIVIARNRFMQTATNYYLFNLAIADLMVLLLGLPLETYSFWRAYPWIFGEAFCVIRTMAAETSTYASILTITAFTIERYIAIVHPMKAQTVSSLPRAVKIIVIIWVLSALCSVPMVVQFGVVYIVDKDDNIIPESALCHIKPDKEIRLAFEVSTFLFFFAPMTVITVLYLLIGLAIRRSGMSRTGSDSSENHRDPSGSELRAIQQARARRAVIKMLVAVVAAFFICWAPFHAQRLMVMYIQQWTQQLSYVQNILFYVSGITYYISSVINPILYSILSLKFRQAFKNSICRPCKRRRKKISLITYKFYNKQLPQQGGTGTTLLKRYHTNPHCVKGRNGGLRNNNVLNGGICNNAKLEQRIPRKSGSSSMSGGSSNRMLRENAQENLEMKIINEVKSWSQERQYNSVQNHSTRPYHSFT